MYALAAEVRALTFVLTVEMSVRMVAAVRLSRTRADAAATKRRMFLMATILKNLVYGICVSW